MRASYALGVGLIAMAVALAIALSGAPATILWSNYTPLHGPFATTEKSVSWTCQAVARVPEGSSAVRPSIYAVYGPRIAVKVLAGNRVLTSGTRSPGWVGESPTVPLRPVRQSFAHAKLCLAFGQPYRFVSIDGGRADASEAVTSGGRRLSGMMRIDFLTAGSRSWWSSATSVARRMGLGNWADGGGVALLWAVLVAAMVAGVSWLTVRELR